jgi:xanthine dehydrogenase accessory factor
MMLFSSSGRYAGLLSGGCLESDLQAHAMRLLEGPKKISLHEYDSRVSDDPVWGLGLGCEGLMRILLLKLDSTAQPVRALLHAAKNRMPLSCHISLKSGEHNFDNPALYGSDTFSLDAEPVPGLLLCGAGPDTRPVVEFARTLGWQVTVLDHRPAYLDALQWPPDVALQIADLDTPLGNIDTSRFDAAVVMSHHLIADGRYLRSLAAGDIPYIGLLGPPARRERLLAEIGDGKERLQNRLRAPVGLDLGGRTPEAIALAIVAEIQASLRGKSGGPFSEV